MRILVAALLASGMLAAPVAAQNSHCAAIAQTAQVEVRGPDNVIPAQLTPRGFSCPRGFTTETVGPVTRCRQPGQIRLENREPRNACYTSLGVAAPRSVNPQIRPTANCPGQATVSNVVALRGRNLGWQDVTVTAPREANVTVEQLRATGGRVPAAEDPVRQDCFAFDCRLVRITTRATTPERVTLTVATPGNASSATIPLTFEASCPTR